MPVRVRSYAGISAVLARTYTRLKPDQATLAGLLVAGILAYTMLMPRMSAGAGKEFESTSEPKPEVRAAVFADLLEMILRGDALHQALGILGLEQLGIQRLQRAVDAQHGRRAHGDVQIGSVLVDHQLKEVAHGEIKCLGESH